MIRITENVYLYSDTCHVYVVKKGENAILIDFGKGDVLDHLVSIGVKRVTDVLMTHHHRDQGQGLERAEAEGIKIWVPHAEQDLFSDVDAHWQSREIDNNYNMRQDRFSLLNSVFVSGTLQDYATYSFAGYDFAIVPTPGHTTGSISLLTTIDGTKLAFTGDLISSPGKVWSMAATQWSYNGAEGVPFSILSLLDLKEKKPDMLLPSHGDIMREPNAAIDLLVERFGELLGYRNQNPRLFKFREKPYENITPHLLKNRTSLANSYVLLSKSGSALIIDFGYDFIGGIASGSDRAARRPWLYTIQKLKKDYGVKKIDVVIPTHYHDDHVAGMNLLRDVEGTKVWCPENFADVLENPKNYDLPCLWYDSIKVDQILPLRTTIKWEEYEFTLYEQSGHTLYAVAIVFEVDGKRVLAMGDQYEGEEWNYVYQNGFRIWDYRQSAELYQAIRPDLLISGHSDPVFVTQEYLNRILESGHALERLHQDLLPLEQVDLGAGGIGARITPYQSYVYSGQPFNIGIDVKNPFTSESDVDIQVIVPAGWNVQKGNFPIRIGGLERKSVSVTITPASGQTMRRARIAADITIGERPFGQLAEALVTVK
ncbi:MBL fold metallo-hydrolase [Fictibacillus phosphorivorans]|uniref:MBL fold metallo-hydrolase n=1 Tax=Fictibacillus phosphorivorans TaxID=1221500 RepID=UPI00203F6D5C|nr:MBL fold metallo-hydrolase [Fictibacillus phosphorivorans]MCM3717779.1 MBL fold metallo-hydrolase [Fictibacillus phosphorivorans]MCM3777007.1 MBL fold metallo-hydrolase [Fictibacillus phosphorivorans]